VNYYSNTLVRLDSEVKFSENVSAAAGIPEQNVFNIDASMEINSITGLLRVNG
jgi:hypothetical protein